MILFQKPVLNQNLDDFGPEKMRGVLNQPQIMETAVVVLPVPERTRRTAWTSIGNPSKKSSNNSKNNTKKK